MACPNKKADEKIIAEIAKRKAAKANKVDEQQPTIFYMTVLYEGPLYNMQWIGIDESKIVSMRQYEKGKWECTMSA